ncbi:hypothetical protein GQX73_g2508 [Xylaria multiplex]|uniref:DUF1330 domain-containing protein n=1 Tax=Xylaria multiplex TaxID=323545 RepID=A0A7C8IYX0_9PEZI|nr:hypothetical protein GQX73_g2508 [Xylaria multiplex]
MVLCSIHIIALKAGTTPASFLASLREAGIAPIVQARVFRWMILPTQLSAGHLLARNIHWDMFLVLASSSPIPESIRRALIAAEWTATVGTSSKLLSGYATTNAGLLHPPPGTVVPAGLDLEAAQKADSSQNLELTPELASFISSLPPHLASHPVSMLNLISFNPGKQAQYVKYGQEFSARVGARYGGRVKIVGKVTSSGAGETTQEGWDEIAFVHYPSIAHFAAMAGDKDYQEVNHKYRLGALKDTFIICVLEVTDDGEVVGRAEKENKMKL